LKTIHKSAKLANVCYDIRGPIMDRARQMEEEGHKIIKLNIGNLAVFGFDAPEVIPTARAFLVRAKPSCMRRKSRASKASRWKIFIWVTVPAN
jgi:aspartate/methionine/tyrosine aminotransferase